MRSFIICILHKRYETAGACTTTLYGLHGRGDRIPVYARFSAPVHTGSGKYPASCTMSTGSFSRGLRRLRRGADHPPTSSPEVKDTASSNKNTQLDATINRKIYCFVVQTLLNMFRALLCPSSGARQTDVAASGFRMNVEVEVFSAVVGLLMPETC